MGLFLKQSTAVDVIVGPFIDDSDGKTAETGLTVTQAEVRLSKNGGNMAQKNEATALAHDELGYYDCNLDATDTNTLGRLQLMVHESGALPVYHEYMVVTANVYDSLCSTDILQADLTQMGGVAQSATDLKDFADAGYDPATDKVQGVVLVDTTTTNSDLVTAAAVNTAVEAGDLSLVLADTNELQTSLADGGFTDLLVDAIKAKTDNLPVDPADDSDIDAAIATLQTAVTAIQNNTRFTAAVPSYMTKPDAGDEPVRMSSNLYDTDGNMEDPVNNEVLVRVFQDDGTQLSALLYKENALTNGLDNPTDDGSFPNASGWRAMEREAGGRYFFFYKVGNAATEETLTVEFGWDEGGNDIFQSRSTEVADVHGDLASILADTNEIQGKLPTNKIMGSSDATDKDDEIDAIKAKTDNLPADPADDSDLDTQLTTITTHLTEIKGAGFATGTDSLIKIHDDHVTHLSAAPSTHAAVDVWTEAMEGAITAKEQMNIQTAALAGKSSGGGTATIKFRDQADGKDRINATVDANGNRTAVTNDGV